MQFHNYIDILIKPTDACNLRCKYCFHKDGGYSTKVMTVDTVEKLYKSVFPYYKSVSITWHGGEPTLLGYEFYYKVLEMQIPYIESGIQIKNHIQTNGTLLTDELIDLFKRFDFNIGLSYDGVTNDITRGQTSKVLSCITHLQEKGFKVGVITVVSKANINYLKENYEKAKQMRIGLQLNHFVDDIRSSIPELKLSVKEYTVEMFKLFEYWFNDVNCCINLNPFTNFILEYLFKKPLLCTRSSCLRCYLCITADGRVTPCDTEFPEKYCYGNISEYIDIRNIYQSQGFINLISASIKRRQKCKDSCELYDYCNGGCNHSALVESGLENNGGFSCESYKSLFGKILIYLNKIDLTLSNFEKKINNPFLLKRIRRRYEES